VVEAVNSFELFDEVIDRFGEPITAETMKDYHRILKRGTADARRPLFAVGANQANLCIRDLFIDTGFLLLSYC